MTDNIQKRIDWIDAIKGIGILLVMVGHCRPEMNVVGRICTGCHVLIFMFAAGMVMNFNMPFADFAVKKIKTLLYPYVIWSLIGCALKRNLSILLKMFTLEGYSVLWFLSAMFGAEILLYMIPKKRWNIVITDAVILLLYFGFRWLGLAELTGAYVCMRAVLSFVFVSAGYMLKDVISKKVFKLIGIFSFVGYIMVCYEGGKYWTFDLHFARIPNISVYFFLAFSGIFGFVAIAQFFQKSMLLQVLGRHSLEFMLVHLYVRDFIMDYIVRFVDVMWIRHIVLSICVISISAIIVWATNRIPWLYRIKRR